MSLRDFIPHSLVNNLKHYPTGFLANLYYRFPAQKLKIIGVTGTDGKTTTATMLYHVLRKAGFKVALISTVSAIIDDQKLDTGFHVTSPDHFSLQKFLRLIANKQIEYVVLETTSHGFAQHRFWGIKFFAGIVTNITKDHFDYHGNWQNYAAAKAKLFAHTQYSVLNIDDQSYPFLKPLASGKIITYGLSKGDFNLKSFPLKLSILGDYNLYNALAVSALSFNLGIDERIIKRLLQNFDGVTGRMQVMHKKPYIIVDFAHTPNALATALTSLSSLTQKNSRLISVFGCAGLRDAGRRQMGQVSGKLADISIITAEDPRTEGVDKISHEIASWSEKAKAKQFSLSDKANTYSDINELKSIQLEITKALQKSHIYIRVPDRQQAINLAIAIARRQDVVAIFGKGHEQTMCFGHTETAWSDQKAVNLAIKKLAKF